MAALVGSGFRSAAWQPLAPRPLRFPVSPLPENGEKKDSALLD